MMLLLRRARAKVEPHSVLSRCRLLRAPRTSVHVLGRALRLPGAKRCGMRARTVIGDPRAVVPLAVTAQLSRTGHGNDAVTFGSPCMAIS